MDKFKLTSEDLENLAKNKINSELKEKLIILKKLMEKELALNKKTELE